ncbi:MAG: hypothetical protein ACTS8S_13890 [Giesbergeria sp.]
MSGLGGAPQPLRAAPRFAAVALAFGPPLLWAGVRAWLEWRAGQQAPRDAFAIAPLPVSQSVFDLFLPWLLGVLALLVFAAVLVYGWRRGRARAVQRVLTVLWVLLWLGGAAGLLVARANTENLVPLPDAQARVLGLRPLPPTLRQLGGSEVVMEVAGTAVPQHVRINDERVALWQPGQRLRVGLGQGQFYGLYLTRWEPAGPAPVVQ